MGTTGFGGLDVANPVGGKFAGVSAGGVPSVYSAPTPYLDFHPEQRGGVLDLPAAITVNNQTALPVFRFNGADADANGWAAWGYGPNLLRTVVGTAPTYNVGSPLPGILDDAVRINASDFYEGSPLSVSTEDLWIEFLIRVEDGTDATVFGTRGVATDPGIRVFVSSGVITILLEDVGDTSVTMAGGTLTEGVWYYIAAAINKSENSTNGGRVYVNAVQGGTQNFSTVGDITSTNDLSLGSRADGSGATFDGDIAYAAMYALSDWFEEGAAGPTSWQALANSRFAQLLGTSEPDLGAPSTATRSTVATISKEDSLGVRRLYTVGPHWLRVEKSPGSSRFGYVAEPASENLILYSSDLSNAAWTKTRATASTTGVDFLNGKTLPTITLAEDGTAANSHFVTQSVTVGAGKHTASVFAKAVNRSWLKIQTNNIGNSGASFDLANGLVGTLNAGVDDAKIVSYGDGWYRCDVTWTLGAATSDFNFFAASADNTETFDGLTQDSLAVGGFQLEAQPASTSPIETTSSTVTRTADLLLFDHGRSFPTAGTIVVDFTANGVPGSISNVVSTYADTLNRHTLQVNSGSPYTGRGVSVVGGGATSIIDSAATVLGNNTKLAYSYATDDFELYRDDLSEGTDVSGAVPAGVDTVAIGAFPSIGVESLNGTIHRVRVYGQENALGD